VSARDWIDKDFYAELGVSSSASAEDVKRAYRKLARELHPDANPGDAKAESRFKAVSEAYGVLSDPDKRAQYDEARRLFGGGGGFRPGGGGFGGPGHPVPSTSVISSPVPVVRPETAARVVSATCSVACSAAGQVRRGRTRHDRGGARTSRPRSGSTSPRRYAVPRCHCACPARRRAGAARARAPGPAPPRGPARPAAGPAW